MWTNSKVVWPYTLKKPSQSFLLRNFNKTINKTIVEQSLATCGGTLIIKPCTYHIKRCHKCYHGNATDHTCRGWNEPAALVEDVLFSNFYLNCGKRRQLHRGSNHDTSKGTTHASPETLNPKLLINST